MKRSILGVLAGISVFASLAHGQGTIYFEPYLGVSYLPSVIYYVDAGTPLSTLISNPPMVLPVYSPGFYLGSADGILIPGILGGPIIFSVVVWNNETPLTTPLISGSSAFFTPVVGGPLIPTIPDPISIWWFAVSDESPSTPVVPEPSIIGLGLAAASGLFLARRRH